MDLKKLIKGHKQDLTIWAPFGGFEIELIYTDRKGLERLVEKCKERKFDRKTHQPIESLSDDKYCAQLATRIKSWRKLTLGKLAELTNIDIADEDPAQIIPCTEANKLTLVDEIYGLNNFIRDTITDLQVFREEELETETKNSRTSPVVATESQ